jgi:phage gp29-like protein
MTQKSLKPVVQEIARLDPLGLDYFTHYDTPAQLLRSEGASSRFFRNAYDLYRDMEDKDAHLFAVLQTRKNGVLSRPRKITAASDNPRDQKIAGFVRKTLDQSPEWDSSLLGLLDALGKGFSTLEIMWKIDRGNVALDALKFRPQGIFQFDANGELHLQPSLYSKLSRRETPPKTQELHHPFEHSALSANNRESSLPPRKFLLFRFGATPESPYGRGLLMKAYWYYWFKKNNLKFWILFNEKFGSPTIIGKYRLGAGEEERKRLHEVVASLQNDTGVTIPENVALEFLEAKRTGAINTYRELADWCNDEMSKLVLGATLTTGEGRRSGSLALGKVHERVRSEYIESDARALMNVINSQLIRWIVDFNFGADTPAPRFVIDTTEDDGLEQEIQVDQELVKMGVPLPLSYFYERYKRPAPLDKEHGLRYDDNNLYQYHIQFGVLTINEVRRTLGLDPVPWGDNPPYSAREIKGKKGMGPAAEEQTREEQERQDREERKREE